jgi:hypothetical protein
MIDHDGKSEMEIFSGIHKAVYMYGSQEYSWVWAQPTGVKGEPGIIGATGIRGSMGETGARGP